jgi:hypothetical protein
MNYTMTQRAAKVLGFLALSTFSGILNAQINWSPAGPIYTAGRARNMIVDKNNASGKTLYVGSTSSGVFKSTDGGVNWAPVNDQASIRNVSYMAQAADGAIWVGTGEGFLRYGQKAKAQPGTGLYKLTGTTLTKNNDSSAVGFVINRVACNPNNVNNIALATNKGILVSTNGGGSFSPASGISTTVNVTFGMDVKFDNSGILYCTIGNERGNHAPFTNVASKVYKSTDASLGSFTDITPVSTVLTDANYGRIELAISPSNNQVIYASCANKNNSLPTTQVSNSASLKGLFVSYNGGATWGLVQAGSTQLDPLSNGGTISTGDYAHCILVNPSNPNQLFIGGYSFFVYTRTGGSDASPIGTWNQLGSPFTVNFPYYLHENIHDIKIISGTPTKFFFVTDAGVYRSTDLISTNQISFPSFQPFYQGLVTGQFNSVSIERYPASFNGATATSGQSITPYVGFIGGTGGNGFTYYSGTSSLVTQETSYLGGEVYNAEYSKILNGAAFLSNGSGNMFRTTNAKNSTPTAVNFNKYNGASISKISPEATSFSNSGFSTGTPFKLWENYGQVSGSPDSVVFYNDTLRFQYSMSGIPTLTTQTTFTFSAARPNRFATIDSVVIRTGTVVLPTSSFANSPAFSGADKQDICVKLSNTAVTPTVISAVSGSGSNTVATTNTVSIYTGTNVTATGPVSTSTVSAPRIVLNATTLQDDISVTFTSAPFANKTTPYYPPPPSAASLAVVADGAAYYRVFATVFYKYKIGDTIRVSDNSISTKVSNYTTVLNKPLAWKYSGTNKVSYVLAANVNTAVPNPTFLIEPSNVIQVGNPSFTVSPTGLTNHTITQWGDYTVTATPVAHTLVAIPSPTSITTPTYILTPGNTTTSTTQSSSVFIVTPSVNTVYTITTINSGTLSPSVTFSTINSSSYVLNPGNITQTTTAFVVSPTVATVYTLQGVSSDTVTGSNTTKTVNITFAKTFSTTGANVPFSKANPLVKMVTNQSARLAMILNNSAVTGNTGNPYAIVVSKGALNLNDPLNFVRVSQSGCWSDDANGNPSNTVVTFTARPTLLEWSKKGTEIYFATDENKLYRVSHITDIMDLSPSSYAGKFYTDVFTYTAPVNASTVNPVSPYRTTLIGTFDKPITSISVSNDDKFLALTFNNPAQTGTTGIVMYNTVDVRTANPTNIGWVKKDAPALAGITAYCSMMEKDDNKKVFVGTDNGIFYTADITAGSPSWSNVNNGQLPNVQVFDIKQQTFAPWDCYNSGQIYVATYGRGVWISSDFFKANIVNGIEESEARTDHNLSIFPNPSNGKVTLKFDGIDGETISISIMDISGRTVKSEYLGTISGGETAYGFETSSLTAGIYLVNVNGSSGVKRVAKLIVTK